MNVKRRTSALKKLEQVLAEPDPFYNLYSFVYLFPYYFGIFMALDNMEDFLQTVGCSCYHTIQGKYSLSSISRNKKGKIIKCQLFHM